MTVADSNDVTKEYPCLFESIKGKDENEMLKFRAKIKKYENFIRTFYLTNPESSEEQFNTEIIEYSRKLQDEIPLTATKAQKYYWQARILNQRSDSKDQALFLLQKSLKLNAYLVDAWTISSQILWEKQRLQATVNCIKDAYDTEVSPKTLAYMSFVLRLSALNCENKQNKESLLKESINKAKLAVTQKPKYSFALFCLGMSYFYYYFNSENNNRDIILDLSLKILQESADEGFLRGDLYINMSEAAIYFQNYPKAIECLENAKKIEPYFCQNKLPNLLEYLSHFASEVAKQKKSLSNRKNAEEIFKSLNEYDGILQNNGKMIDDKKVSWTSKNLKKRKLSEIKEIEGKNAEEKSDECIFIVLRILTQINTNFFPVPKAFVVSDENCNVAILTIYNVSQNFHLMVNSNLTLFSPVIINVTSPKNPDDSFQCL
uniref:Tetratricopeptide repeat protein 5 OB fold domain-containing protein n=1 Tax=Panagrolaimus sp. PS1159 TaxID=55785 RepID=A0AC35G224_9BILA